MLTRTPSIRCAVLALLLALAALCAGCSAGGADSKAPDANPCGVGTPFLCANGGCIPRSQACDGRIQCSDGSDERNCTTPDARPASSYADAGSCSGTQFRCDNGLCLQSNQRCDGTSQCPGGDDEHNCGSCGGVSEVGECVDGTAGVRYCQDGQVETITCSSGYSCGLDRENDRYDCIASGGCGSVTWQGGCEDHQTDNPNNSGGDYLYYCDGEGASAEVVWIDCYPDFCAYVGDVYDCVPYDNACSYAYDGICDEPSYCEYGSDQNDCYYYGNTCGWAYDGRCDEPGLCWYGTDNYDCVNYW